MSSHRGGRPRRLRLFVLYEDSEGGARNQWQRMGAAAVPGCQNYEGHHIPPPFRWVVRARSAKEACRYARRGQRPTKQAELGVLWDRKADGLPAPVVKARGRGWVFVSWCAEEVGFVENLQTAEELRQKPCSMVPCRGYHAIFLYNRHQVERFGEFSRLEPVDS